MNISLGGNDFLKLNVSKCVGGNSCAITLEA